MNTANYTIQTGSRAAVIGGGPAGSFFAIYLQRYAAEHGIRPEITIYQERRFADLGPKGCKGCAGILSLSFLRNLAELGLSIPRQIVQGEIKNYTVHSPYSAISISNPEKGEIISVYRGGGPRISHYEHPISFDDWLLSEALKSGARVEYQRVSAIDLENRASVTVGEAPQEYDLIVLATGVNTKPITVRGHNYRPPRTRTMAVLELQVGADRVQSRLGRGAHAFLLPRSGLVFGTLVPKGPFINVSLLSTGQPSISMTDFLGREIARQMLPEDSENACNCRPRAVISAARHYYADRFVAIGDAAVSRLYKDGIGSAMLTARQAAATVVGHGLRRKDFARHYQPFCRRLQQDNWWGKLLFKVNDKAKDSRAFLLAQHRLIGDEQNNVTGPQPFTRAAWGMFTGNYRYRTIAWMALNPISLARTSWALFLEGARGLSRRTPTPPKKLFVGSRKVLILGSGFGGTYTLRHLVRSLNKNENVQTTMVSEENFFLFTPLLHEVAMGAVETRHIAYPIRRLHWRDRFNFIQGEVQKIDLEAHQVVTTAGTLDYDFLALALGSVNDMSELSTRPDNVFTLKTLRDSLLLRDHIIGLFEQASTTGDTAKQKQLLTFIVAGGGYRGVQLVCECRDFIFRNLTRFYRPVSPENIRIMLVQADPKIIPELHTKFGAYAMKQMRRMGIEVRLESRVTRVDESGVEINHHEIVPTQTLVWVAGVTANPRVAELAVPRDNLGRVGVNEYLEIPGFPGVYAVGDCASFPQPRTGHPIPPRAHTAVRQAKVAAHNILAEIRGRDRRPYRYSQNAEMVSLGAAKAIFRFHGIRIYGLVGRFLWIAAYSLLITGSYNRIRVIIDWLLSLIFGRDTTYLKFKD